jgi:hypothetical protein
MVCGSKFDPNSRTLTCIISKNIAINYIVFFCSNFYNLLPIEGRVEIKQNEMQKKQMRNVLRIILNLC